MESKKRNYWLLLPIWNKCSHWSEPSGGKKKHHFSKRFLLAPSGKMQVGRLDLNGQHCFVGFSPRVDAKSSLDVSDGIRALFKMTGTSCPVTSGCQRSNTVSHFYLCSSLNKTSVKKDNKHGQQLDPDTHHQHKQQH